MKKILLVLTALALWQNWDRIDSWLNPTQAGNASGEVVLYATQWCGYCAKTREFLDERGIAFTEHDIEKSAEARHAYQALGGRGVPVLKVNGKVIHGYDPQGILAAY